MKMRFSLKAIAVLLAGVMLCGCRARPEATGTRAILSTTLPGITVYGAVRHDDLHPAPSTCSVPPDAAALSTTNPSGSRSVPCARQETFEWDGTGAQNTQAAVREVKAVLERVTRTGGRILWRHREDASLEVIGLTVQGHYRVLTHSNVGLHSYLQIAAPLPGTGATP